MFESKPLRLVASGLCSVGLFAPTHMTEAATPETPAGSSIRTNQPTKQISEIRDVQLLADGTLRGQFVTNANEPLAQAPVELHLQNRLVAKTTTDAEGNFKLENVEAGLYRLAAPEADKVVRVWKANAAPPAAHNSVLLVADREAIRGNFGEIGGGILRWSEWKSGVVAAAIITGAAVAQGYRQRDKDSGS